MISLVFVSYRAHVLRLSKADVRGFSEAAALRLDNDRRSLVVGHLYLTVSMKLGLGTALEIWVMKEGERMLRHVER